MEYSIVYIVMCDGELEYASPDIEKAETYAENKMYEARGEILSEWNYDDPTENNINEANFQLGVNGDYCEVIDVDISRAENDMVKLPDGEEIEVSDILEKLKKCE